MAIDDMMEFLEKAIAVKSEDDDDLRIPTSETKGSSIERKKIFESSVNQYANIGGAYMPTSTTIKTLPPDSYILSMTNEGSPIFVPQKLVTDNLMRLPDSKSEEVIKEVETFWTLKDKFRQYGFSHKRGFLLWGNPGSGKTSSCSIIVSDMVKAGGTVFIAENPHVLAKALSQFRVIEPERPLVVLMEDIDSIIQNYGETAVLSILDGEHSVANVCYIATTNYPEKLDGRIINRPSRFDKIIKIGLPNAAAREMYLRSKTDILVIDGYDIVKETEGLSIAHLKELIIAHHCQGNPIKEVLTRLQKMKQKVSSESDHNPLGFGLK
jgi:hypothetical protein